MIKVRFVVNLSCRCVDGNRYSQASKVLQMPSIPTEGMMIKLGREFEWSAIQSVWWNESEPEWIEAYFDDVDYDSEFDEELDWWRSMGFSISPM